MSGGKIIFRRKLKPSEIRLILYLVVLLAVAAWKFLPRPWRPTQIKETAHFKVYSTATAQQTADTAHALELLYLAYSNQLGDVSGCRQAHLLLQVKLYKNRTEMRRVNPGLGWAEAFYQKPYCRAYYAADEINPFHWMLHESVHQLNCEVARLQLAHWLDEGLSEYFSTSRLLADKLATGQIDRNTYPVWWLDDLATSNNLAENLKNGSVIPLQAILTDHGGPPLDTYFNLYYLHWWTLTYFLFESGKYHDRFPALVQSGGKIEDFERLIGPVESVQTEWHDYVRHLKAALSGKEREFFKKSKTLTPLGSSTNSASN